MNSFFTFYLPLLSEVTADQVKLMAEKWIKESIWYSFQETSFPLDEKEGTLIYGENGRTTWFKHCEFSQEDHWYLGYRLESQDEKNRHWRAEAVFSLDGKENGVYVRQDCGIRDQMKSVDLSELPGILRYPRIIRVLYDHKAVAPDHDLMPGEITRIEEMDLTAVETVFLEKSRLNLPVIYFYIKDSAQNKELMMETLAPFFSRIGHVYLAFTEDENRTWNAMLKRTGADGEAEEHSEYQSQIHLPQIHLFERILLAEDLEKETVYGAVMEKMTRVQMNYPLDAPNWQWLHYQELLDRQKPGKENFQINMNGELAARMLTARRQHKLTQGQLAKKVGVSGLLISRLERLETIKTKRSLIHEIETALGLEYNELCRLEIVEEEKEASVAKKKNRTFKFCYTCGAKLMEGSIFCQKCGQKL